MYSYIFAVAIGFVIIEQIIQMHAYIEKFKDENVVGAFVYLFNNTKT